MNRNAMKSLFLIFVTFLLTFEFSSGETFEPNYGNLQEKWKCKLNLTNTGNFPEEDLHDLATYADIKKWSTLSPTELHRMAHNWSDHRDIVGFYIKPKDKVVIHLAANLEHPLYGPYRGMKNFTLKDAINQTSLFHSQNVLPQGPFNCYIRKDIDFKMDILNQQVTECPKDKSLIDCFNERETWKNYQCYAGIKNPGCCYIEALTVQKDLNVYNALEELSGNVEEGIANCRAPQRVGSDPDMEKECPVDSNLSEFKKSEFYVYNTNPDCNYFMRQTKNGCLITQGREIHIMPCKARCAIGMVMNLEFTPGADDESVISVVQQYTEFDQRFFDANRDQEIIRRPNEFGYDENVRNAKLKDQILVLKKRLSGLNLKPNEWNSIWMQWKMRKPQCLTASKIEAPVLWIGVEGESTAKIEVDFACTGFEGDEKDQIGWRNGWLGHHVLIPNLTSVWKPSHYAINSPIGQEFSIVFNGTKPQCHAKALEKPFPPSLIAALVFAALIILSVTIICLVGDRLY